MNMNKAKVVKVDSYGITFDNGVTMSSEHSQDCCESHELYFKDLTLADFEGLEFDLSGDKFFERIDGYGIALLPLVGHPVRVAGHGYNNGYYSSDMTLALYGPNGFQKSFDISECQDIQG